MYLRLQRGSPQVQRAQASAEQLCDLIEPVLCPQLLLASLTLF